ncbi:MAG: hypothetical protein AAGC72_00760 [Planctomycetota bacterium]
MVRLINQHDLDAAQSLSEAELIRLRAQISVLVNEALQARKQSDSHPEEAPSDNSLMDLYGILHSDVPKATDAEVNASIAKHIAQENPRPGG